MRQHHRNLSHHVAGDFSRIRVPCFAAMTRFTSWVRARLESQGMHDCIWNQLDRRVAMARNDSYSAGVMVNRIITVVAQKRRLLGIYRQQRAVDCVGNLQFRAGIGSAATMPCRDEHSRCAKN